MSDAEFLEHLLHNPTNPSPSYLNDEKTLNRPLALAVGQLLEPLPYSFEPNWFTDLELESFGISYDSHSPLGTLNMLKPEISVPERKPSTTMTPYSLDNPTVWVDELIGSSSSLDSEALHDSRARVLSSIEYVLFIKLLHFNLYEHTPLGP